MSEGKCREPRKIEIKAVCTCGTEEHLNSEQFSKVFCLYNYVKYICLDCGAEMRVQVVDLQESTIINVIKEY